MKKITILFFSFLFVFEVNASTYVELSLRDDSVKTGELIEIYEDRWFWEAPTNERYFLLFEDILGKASFHFIKEADIVKTKIFATGPSAYKNYLYSHNLVFKNAIVPGSVVLTGHEGHHKFEKMFGNFAWDIGMRDLKGNQFKNAGLNLEDYYIFNQDVFSPVNGVVVGKIAEEPDNNPSPNLVGDLTGKENNYLTIKIAEPFYLSIVHFRQNSIAVNIGDKVVPKQILGKVGNSGVSYIPHLHYTMYIYLPVVKRFISVPGYFE